VSLSDTLRHYAVPNLGLNTIRACEQGWVAPRKHRCLWTGSVEFHKLSTMPGAHVLPHVIQCMLGQTCSVTNGQEALKSVSGLWNALWTVPIVIVVVATASVWRQTARTNGGGGEGGSGLPTPGDKPPVGAPPSFPSPASPNGPARREITVRSHRRRPRRGVPIRTRTRPLSDWRASRPDS